MENEDAQGIIDKKTKDKSQIDKSFLCIIPTQEDAHSDFLGNFNRNEMIYTYECLENVPLKQKARVYFLSNLLEKSFAKDARQIIKMLTIVIINLINDIIQDFLVNKWVVSRENNCK